MITAALLIGRSHPPRRFADRTVVPGVHDPQGKAKQRGRSVTFVTFRAQAGLRPLPAMAEPTPYLISLRMNPISPVCRERLSRSASRIVQTLVKHSSTSSLTSTYS